MRGRAGTPLALLVALVAGSPAFGEEFVCPEGARIQGEAPPRGVKQWCALEDGTQQGPSVFWFAFGRRRVEASFCEGRLCGAYRRWWDNGQLAEEGTYEDDQKHGVFTDWDANGTKRVFQEYRKGVIHGSSKAWWPNARPMLDLHYVDGERHGSAATWFESGRMQTRGEFHRGRRDGAWTAWYPDGNKKRVAVFEEGGEVSREQFPPAGSRAPQEVENE